MGVDELVLLTVENQGSWSEVRSSVEHDRIRVAEIRGVAHMNGDREVDAMFVVEQG